MSISHAQADMIDLLWYNVIEFGICQVRNFDLWIGSHDIVKGWTEG